MDPCEVSEFLSDNRDFVESWLVENAEPDWLNDIADRVRREKTDSSQILFLTLPPSDVDMAPGKEAESDGEEDDYSSLEDTQRRAVVPRVAR